jgi:hypothetical protein
MNPLTMLISEGFADGNDYTGWDWDAILSFEPSISAQAVKYVQDVTAQRKIALTGDEIIRAALTANAHLSSETISILLQQRTPLLCLSPSLNDTQALTAVSRVNVNNPRIVTQKLAGHTLKGKPLTAARIARNVRGEDLPALLPLLEEDTEVVQAVREEVRRRLRGWNPSVSTDKHVIAANLRNATGTLTCAYSLGLGSESFSKKLTHPLTQWLVNPCSLMQTDPETASWVGCFAHVLHGEALRVLLNDYETQQGSKRILPTLALNGLLKNPNVNLDIKSEMIVSYTQGYPHVCETILMTKKASTRKHWHAVAVLHARDKPGPEGTQRSRDWLHVHELLHSKLNQDPDIAAELALSPDRGAAKIGLQHPTCSVRTAAKARSEWACSYFTRRNELVAYLSTILNGNEWQLVHKLLEQGQHHMSFEELAHAARDILARTPGASNQV